MHRNQQHGPLLDIAFLMLIALMCIPLALSTTPTSFLGGLFGAKTVWHSPASAEVFERSSLTRDRYSVKTQSGIISWT